MVKTLNLSEPYSITYESVDRADNIFLNIITRDGYRGWGCAAPVKSITGESPEDVLNCFSSTIEPLIKGEDIFRYAYIIETLKKEFEKHPTRNATSKWAIELLIL